jgi:hypothetical protein
MSGIQFPQAKCDKVIYRMSGVLNLPDYIKRKKARIIIIA